MAKINKPNYIVIRESIIGSLQNNYFLYKRNYMQYLDLTWYGQDGTFCVMSGYDEALKRSNEYLDKVKKDIEELDLCNKIIQDGLYNDSKEYTDDEVKLLKMIGFLPND